jgi:hypothetical protein
MAGAQLSAGNHIAGQGKEVKAMQPRGRFDDDRWHRRNRQQGHGDNGSAEIFAELRELLTQAGLWAAGCLAVASMMPPVLVAPVLRELLLLSAVLVSLTCLPRGEKLSLRHFNRQDVALALVALALIAGLFVDHAALETLAQESAAARQG